MKVTTLRTAARIIRRYEITENHPVVPAAYFDPPKKVLVVDGSIEYTWTDGKWVVDSEYALKVTGHVLKADGTPGKSTHSRHASMPDWRSRELGDDWKWLQPVIDRLRPVGDIDMALLDENEVGE